MPVGRGNLPLTSAATTCKHALSWKLLLEKSAWLAFTVRPSLQLATTPFHFSLLTADLEPRQL